MKYRHAVFVVAYSKDKNNKNKVEYILLKRKLHWKGWEFPKGKIEKGENKIDTAKRELKEETGLKLIKIKKFDFNGKYFYEKPLVDRPGLIGQTFSLFATEVKKGKVTLDSKEHNGHKWVNFEEAIKLLTWQNQKRSMKIVDGWLKRN